MRLQLCALKDLALDAFQRPFYAQTTNHAKRMFTDLMADQNSEAARHPADFALYHLGTWDDHTGKTTDNAQPELLMRGTDASKFTGRPDRKNRDDSGGGGAEEPYRPGPDA